jgi:hypothetical protein
VAPQPPVAARELDYALRKDLWSFHGGRIAVRFHYECHDAGGYMKRREASINDVPIALHDSYQPYREQQDQ